MIRPPPILDKIADIVLTYSPPDKKKKLAVKKKTVEKKKNEKPSPKNPVRQ